MNKLIALLICLVVCVSSAFAQPTGGDSGGGGGGDASAANQTTMITNQDDLEALVVTIDAVLDSIDLDTTNMSADTGNIDSNTSGTKTSIELLEGAEDSALASGVLLQGDDGTDRKNVAVDPTTGNLQVDVASVTQPTVFSASENAATAQTDNELVAAPGAGVQLCITDIVVSNGATAGEVKLVEDTASAVDVVETIYVGVNGGAVVNFTTPICLTADKNLGFTSTTVTTHSVTVSGFQQ